MKPKRIQRKRTKGFKMPENTIYVGRPGKWGNPFLECANRSRIDAVMQFQNNITKQHIPYPTIQEIKNELHGKNLACWCPLTEPCHADALLIIANS